MGYGPRITWSRVQTPTRRGTTQYQAAAPGADLHEAAATALTSHVTTVGDGSRPVSSSNNPPRPRVTTLSVWGSTGIYGQAWPIPTMEPQLGSALWVSGKPLYG